MKLAIIKVFRGRRDRKSSTSGVSVFVSFCTPCGWSCSGLGFDVSSNMINLD
jgi:hypothetical protein